MRPPGKGGNKPVLKMSWKNFMVSVLSVLLAIGAVVTGGCAGNETATRETPTRIIENITPQEAYSLIQENQDNPDFVILDVRTPAEFSGGHIENAVNLDYYSETFREELDKLDKNQTYLIYCRSGTRSGKTLALMSELTFRKVYNVLNGIIAWEAERLPTTK